MADRVFVSNLRVSLRGAATAEETPPARAFFVDIDCAVDDDTCGAVSYVALCDLAAEASQSAPFKRVAVWGERVAAGVLSRFASVSEIRIRIRDPAAAVASKIDQAGVELTRVRSTEVAFSLGSNVGNKTANLRSALARLDGDPHIEIDAVSHFYRTEPWGKSDQDWFVNACATGRTSLRPRDLLRRCKAIEIQIGRTPGVRWGPRVIDIDLLYFGDEAVLADDLTLPHPEMFNRAFVLAPLAEIAGDRVIAGRRVSEAAELLQRSAGEIEQLDET